MATDPGWVPAIKVLRRFFFALSPRVRSRRFKEMSVILSLRVMTLVGPLSLSMFLILLLIIRKSKEAPRHQTMWVIIVAAVGVVSLAGVSIIRRRSLGTTESLQIASRYTRRFFLGWAIGESPALIGFVGFFQGGRLATYLSGFAFALVAFAMNAPTRARIESEQARLRRDQHSTVNLLDALLIPTDQLPQSRSR